MTYKREGQDEDGMLFASAADAAEPQDIGTTDVPTMLICALEAKHLGWSQAHCKHQLLSKQNCFIDRMLPCTVACEGSKLADCYLGTT